MECSHPRWFVIFLSIPWVILCTLLIPVILGLLGLFILTCDPARIGDRRVDLSLPLVESGPNTYRASFDAFLPQNNYVCGLKIPESEKSKGLISLRYRVEIENVPDGAVHERKEGALYIDSIQIRPFENAFTLDSFPLDRPGTISCNVTFTGLAIGKDLLPKSSRLVLYSESDLYKENEGRMVPIAVTPR
jgi:hypothetical protein